MTSTKKHLMAYFDWKKISDLFLTVYILDDWN